MLAAAATAQRSARFAHDVGAFGSLMIRALRGAPKRREEMPMITAPAQSDHAAAARAAASADAPSCSSTGSKQACSSRDDGDLLKKVRLTR